MHFSSWNAWQEYKPMFVDGNVFFIIKTVQRVCLVTKLNDREAGIGSSIITFCIKTNGKCDIDFWKHFREKGIPTLKI